MSQRMFEQQTDQSDKTLDELAQDALELCNSSERAVQMVRSKDPVVGKQAVDSLNNLKSSTTSALNNTGTSLSHSDMKTFFTEKRTTQNLEPTADETKSFDI